MNCQISRLNYSRVCCQLNGYKEATIKVEPLYPERFPSPIFLCGDTASSFLLTDSRTYFPPENHSFHTNNLFLEKKSVTIKLKEIINSEESKGKTSIYLGRVSSQSSSDLSDTVTDVFSNICFI